MAEINTGLTIKSVSERMLAPIESLGESAHESMSPDTLQFVTACQQPERLAKLGSQVVEAEGDLGPRGLADDKVMMADTFQQFADDVVAPLAERIHREDEIIPDSILQGLKDLGCFGLSVPEQYGGLLPNDREDTLGMIVVTEELSRASLGELDRLSRDRKFLPERLWRRHTGAEVVLAARHRLWRHAMRSGYH